MGNIYIYLWIENGEENNYINMSGAAARTGDLRSKKHINSIRNSNKRIH